MSELSPVEEAIHVAICELSPDECREYRGRCVRAAEAAVPMLPPPGAPETTLMAVTVGLADELEAVAPPADWYRADDGYGDNVIWARRPGGNHDAVIATSYDTSPALWEWLERVVPEGEPGDPEGTS